MQIDNSNWSFLTIGDFVSLQRGHDLTSEQRKEGNIPVVGAAGYNGFHNIAKAKGPGLVVGRSGGSYGQVHFVKEDFWPHNTAMYVVDFKGNAPLFAYYLLKQLDFSSLNSGSAQPSLNRNFIYPVKIFIPKPHIQSQIAKVLSDLDAKIELNNKINAELEAMAKLIYDYWFVQFEFPNENGKPYKSSGGKMVWNDELKRDVPEGWEVGILDDIADLVRGVSYSKDDIKSKDDQNALPILRATNISGNKIDLDQMVYVPSHLINENQLLNKFEILITMSSGSIDHIGKNGMYYFDQDVAFGAFCAKLVAKKDFEYYLFSFTQSDFMTQTIKNECLGTNINNLNGAIVKGFKLIIPRQKYIQLFNQHVSTMFKQISSNTRENQKLAELRDWLLPMLMNGQVKVSER